MALSVPKGVLERALSGDPAAIEALVAAVTPHVEKQLRRYNVANEDRRDLLQSTLVKMTRRLRSFRGDSKLSTWLFRITENEALMMLRSQRRHRARLVVGLDLEELGSLPGDDIRPNQDHAVLGSDLENFVLVRRAIAELPENYRDAIVAHYYLECSLREIANRLGETETAVRSRLYRARSLLRAILEGCC